MIPILSHSDPVAPGHETYRTSQIARAVKVHPNTVRLYEQWGLIPPVPRSRNGYRIYTRRHLEQMRLARIALRCEFVEGDIRKRAVAIVKAAASGKLPEALQMADEYLIHVRNERIRAQEALDLARKWVNGELPEETSVGLQRTTVAKLLEVSQEILRNWERNGLITIPRDPKNHRVYGPQELGRLKIIRTLRSANYSMMAILRMMNHIRAGRTDDVGEVLNTPSSCEDILLATDHWISTLTETESDAGGIIRQIKTMLESGL